MVKSKGNPGKRPVPEVAESSRPTRKAKTTRPPPPLKPSKESRLMRNEAHPWLKWLNCDAQRKIELNNKLALLQHKTMAQPRMVDWDYINSLGISEELDRMFNTSYADQNGRREIPVWKKALEVKDGAYRELCLEFYCSLKLKKREPSDDVLTTELITFRLGGVERSVTVAEFGVLTGMFTRQEVSRESWMRGYLQWADWDFDKFKVNENRVWNRMSGNEVHKAQSKAKDIHSPTLRVVHKLLAHSFFHRSSQHDKVYAEDLWVLDYMDRKAPERFVNAPWALASYMEERGAGRQHDSAMVCGHFITTIAKSLGLASYENVRLLSPVVEWKKLVKRDFLASGIVKRDGGLVEKGEAVPRSPPRKRARGPLIGAINQLSKQMKKLFKQNEGIDQKVARIDRNVEGIGNHYNYVLNRYQPSWEAAAMQHHASGSSSEPLGPFAPPMMFPPSPPREESEEEEESESEEEEEEQDEGESEYDEEEEE